MKKRKNFKVTAEVVKGECPTCNDITTLVGIDSTFYRCISCGEDLEQKINGVIKYLKVDRHTDLGKHSEELTFHCSFQVRSHSVILIF
jgi:ribosomal protein S27E